MSRRALIVQLTWSIHCEGTYANLLVTYASLLRRHEAEVEGAEVSMIVLPLVLTEDLDVVLNDEHA